MICPQCQSTRVRPLLPITNEDRSVYECRSCGARWQLERRATHQERHGTAERRNAGVLTDLEIEHQALRREHEALIQDRERLRREGGDLREQGAHLEERHQDTVRLRANQKQLRRREQQSERGPDESPG
jgi:DNA-directed RNA polymerase subunit M/transcription elongation factor TFIIS